MIKCTDSDKPEMLAYLKQNPSENCFFIGDVENFDFDEEFIDLWKPGENQPIDCMLMRFYGYYHITASNDKYYPEMAQIIKQDPEAEIINGIQANILKMEKLIPFVSSEKSYLAELRKDNFKKTNTEYLPERAVESDIDELFEFQKSIEEFGLDEKNRRSFGNEIRTNSGRTFFIRENGRIISSATITAENSCNGMIIGVATDKEYRKRGYAIACVSKICEEMTAAGKQVLLFYNNPAAGKLYKLVGFADIGYWMKGTLK